MEVLCGVNGAAIHTFEGTEAASQLGRALIGVPDVDGDEIDDVLAAAFGRSGAEEGGPRGFELVLLGSRGRVVQTIVYPEPQATAVEMRAAALPGAPSGTPSGFGLLISVRRKDKTASASWGVPFAGERYDPAWVLELGSPYYVGTISGHMPLALIDGARCLLTVIGPDGPRVIAVERDTGKEVLRLEPPRQGKHLRAVAYLHVEGDTAGRIVVSVPDGCNGGHRAALQPVVPGQESKLGAHDTVLWYRADDGKLVARMCERDFAAHAHRLDRNRALDQSQYFGTALQALPRRPGGERTSDLLVIADARFSDGIVLVMDLEQLEPLAIAPVSTATSAGSTTGAAPGASQSSPPTAPSRPACCSARSRPMAGLPPACSSAAAPRANCCCVWCARLQPLRVHRAAVEATPSVSAATK